MPILPFNIVTIFVTKYALIYLVTKIITKKNNKIQT